MEVPSASTFSDACPVADAMFVLKEKDGVASGDDCLTPRTPSPIVPAAPDLEFSAASAFSRMYRLARASISDVGVPLPLLEAGFPDSTPAPAADDAGLGTCCSSCLISQSEGFFYVSNPAVRKQEEAQMTKTQLYVADATSQELGTAEAEPHLRALG